MKTDSLLINVGPQHPSTHGVLRLKMRLYGERIKEVEPIVGYLHRGMEKLAENRTYYQYLPMVDRVDYLSSCFYQYAFCNAVEMIAGFTVPRRAEYLRVITMELNRIASHLVWLGAMLLDLGAQSPIFYAFREREAISELLDDLTGNRMLYNYYCFGGVKRDVPDGWIERVRTLLNSMPDRFWEYEKIITGNPIFLKRCKGLGVLSAQKALAWGLTGPNLRASGVAFDLRATNPYSIYNELDFKPAVMHGGDTFDRYLVRMQEMHDSVSLVRQALDKLPGGTPQQLREEFAKSGVVKDEYTLCCFDKKVFTKKSSFLSFKPPAGEATSVIEAPRGMSTCYVNSDGSAKPYRVRFRTGSFSGVQILPEMVRDLLYADLIAIFGSLDVVLPEVDR